MCEAYLTENEKKYLLHQARLALISGVTGKPLGKIAVEKLPEKMRQPGATFVTLTIDGQLRGCVGTLEAYQPLIDDVHEHAIAAALNDFRFPLVQEDEIEKISIEISRLTSPKPLSYTNPEELLRQLRPGVDGVVLRDGFRRATFLPQVWEKIPDAETFLNQLCIKMGASQDLWRTKNLDVLVYQVEEFHE
jgi:AmmeMemoRadiSam system protein A